ncbi:unnamed protein product [Nippostrongylus brasiliensis]|uniref:Strictosidine synthase conserved region domain-containing protein n=1 Tax=Nippostrongylus brasiliensis TaxID=27835 RepID=A0A3P7AJN9_NIPBR|nr:unnamed protein product [Nippostrongylus brasiliensis]
MAIAVACTHLFVASPIDAVEFRLPRAPPFEGDLAPNQRLTKAELLLEDQVYGPESIAINRNTGKVYTGLKTGLICEIDIIRLTSLDGCDGSYHSMVKCGRPLGLRIHPKTDELFVLDAYLGLFSINWKTELALFSTSFRYLNDFDFLPDGCLVISESSTKFDDRDFIYDLLEHRPNGRMLAYNPVTDEISVLLDGLYFPNGIQVVRGKVLIAEMGKARVLSGNAIWVPIAAIRSDSDNWLAARPTVRSLLTKVRQHPHCDQSLPSFW